MHKNNLLLLFNYIKPFKLNLIILIFLSTFLGFFEAISFKILALVVDWTSLEAKNVVFQNHYLDLIYICAFLLFVVILSFFQAYIKNKHLSYKFTYHIQQNIHKEFLQKSISFFNQNSSGKISHKVISFSNALRDSIISITDSFLYVIVYFVSILLICLTFNSYLLIPFLIWLVLYIASIYFLIPKLKTNSIKNNEAKSNFNGSIVDIYSNFYLFKVNSNPNRELNRIKHIIDKSYTQSDPLFQNYTLIELSNALLNTLLFISVIVLSIYLYSIDQVNSGSILATGSMALRLIGFSHWMMWECAGFTDKLGVIYDGLNLLNTNDEFNTEVNQNTHNLITSIDKITPINITNLAFSYANNQVYKNFNLEIKHKEKIGLVGLSGSGKSTLINLILKLYPVKDNMIKFNNIDINHIQNSVLHDKIAVVSQDLYCLNETLLNNITYGIENYSQNDLNNAIKKANLDFIDKIIDPQGNTGLNALIGERGARLSGGQKQRINIARVFLKNPELIILDEATSALDSSSEQAIIASLNELFHDKTVIAIAHRLSTLKHMDTICVLDSGQIIEKGNHNQLIENKKIYFDLWSKQINGFIHENDS